MAQSKIAEPSSLKRRNRFLIMLLVGAAVVSAAKDLGRLHDFTNGVVSIAASVHERLNAGVPQPVAPSCPEALAENDRSGQPYNWNGRVAPERLIANDGYDAAPAAGGHLVAANEVGCSEPAAVLIRISSRPSFEPSFEIASRTQRPRESATRRHDAAEAANAANAANEQSSAVSQAAAIRRNDSEERRSLNVSGAPTVAALSRIINRQESDASFVEKSRTLKVCPLGTIAASPLVAGREIAVSSTLGRTQLAAKILGRIVSLRPVAAHPQLFELETGDGTITVDLLQILRAASDADALEDQAISADSQRTRKKIIERTILIEPATAEEETH